MKSNGFFLFFLTLFSSYGYCLDVGSVLTVKIEDTSESRKTIRINRGSDDGLVKGDHAKFYLTQSIIARALCLSVKPRRSVWSVYRLVHPDLVARNELMNLKITEPLKVTDKKYLNIVGDTSEAIRLDQSANGDYVTYSDLVRDEQKGFSLNKETPTLKSTSLTGDLDYKANISKKKIELWTQMGFHFYKSEVLTENEDFAASEFFNQFMGGIEVYIGRLFSIQAVAQYLQESLLSFDGSITDSVLLEYGGSLQFYISNPHRSNSAILYLTGGAALGKITDAFAGGANLPASSNTLEVQGDSRSLFAGLGLKYHLKSGFGMRMLLDYYMRQDSFIISTSNNEEWLRNKQGPRLMLGISYRF